MSRNERSERKKCEYARYCFFDFSGCANLKSTQYVLKKTTEAQHDVGAHFQFFHFPEHVLCAVLQDEAH